MKISTVLLSGISVILCHTNNNIEFNRDLVSVYFEPWLFPGEVANNYGEKELTKMIETISSKFSKIKLPQLNWNLIPDFSTSLIPNTTAKFNKNRTKGQRPMEVTLTYAHQLEEDVYTNFDFQKKLADDANSIHDGTVTTILLFYNLYLNNNSIQSITASLAHAQQQIRRGPSSYKLGAYLSIQDCNSVKLLEKLSNYTDIIFFHRWAQPLDYKFTVSTYSSWIMEELGTCREKVGKIGKHIEVGFNVQRSDTPQGASQRFEDLVTFWDQMNNWAVISNTSIIFFEAIDNNIFRGESYKFCGWWRARDGANGALLDFTLEEKATIINHGSTGRGKSFTNFSRNNFMVYVDPWVAPYEFERRQAYDHSALINMIDKISSRFSKILLAATNIIEYREKHTQKLLSSAAAYWNKNRTNSSPPPIEVVLICHLEEPGKSENSEIGSFEIAKMLADEANSIYPGTVSTILVKYASLETQSAHGQAQLISFRNKIDEGKFNYKLGMYLPPENCGGLRGIVGPFLIPVLPLMDIVYFERFPSILEHNEGVESSFPLIFKYFERCHEKVRKANKHISTGFSTEWPDTNNNSVKNVSALVSFWERANDWAVAVNSSVMLFDAFDTYIRISPSDRTQGWWTLDTNRSYKHQSEFVFLEKAEQIKSREQISDNLNSSQHPNLLQEGLQATTIVMIIVGSVTVVLVFIGVAVWMVYKRILKQVKVKALTRTEVREFFDGKSSSTEGLTSNICNVPYNKDLEISKDAYTIDETSLLGMGTFGVVYKAVIRTDREIESAVKMTMESSPSTAVKNLLSEVKILSHVGQHENIVGMIGANTAEISKGKVFVFFELCPNGSLESYLKKYHPQYELTENNKEEGASPVIVVELTEVEESELASELQKWSFEIASGMEFLAEKHVVHGDLATRNVLLTESKTAKISDFGLSRRMYNYTNYLKTQIGEPLPWRWMAPESFRRLEFGEKTDVWAFGVTLWEIFSLGDIPYPGLDWTTEFPKKIEEGLRCDKPRRASAEMYEIMKRCWDPSPRKRPAFFELKEMFSKKLKDIPKEKEVSSSPGCYVDIPC